MRAHRLYGMSPVERAALTVNTALRREAATLDTYRSGKSPDAFANLPKEWTGDQIRQFQDYFDALMSGNTGQAADAEVHAVRLQADRNAPAAAEGPLRRVAGARDLLRLLRPRHALRRPGQSRRPARPCACRRRRKGWCRSKTWIKNALDQVIQVCMGEPGLEFVWVGDDAVYPLHQARIKTREEAGGELRLGNEGGCSKYR